MQKTTIKFKVGSKQVNFNVYHNLPSVHGLSIDSALSNWVIRTSEYTAKSLCEYINSKETEYTCMTEEEHFELVNENSRQK